jgi:hypothetical protein
VRSGNGGLSVAFAPPLPLHSHHHRRRRHVTRPPHRRHVVGGRGQHPRLPQRDAAVVRQGEVGGQGGQDEGGEVARMHGVAACVWMIDPGGGEARRPQTTNRGVRVRKKKIGCLTFSLFSNPAHDATRDPPSPHPHSTSHTAPHSSLSPIPQRELGGRARARHRGQRQASTPGAGGRGGASSRVGGRGGGRHRGRKTARECKGATERGRSPFSRGKEGGGGSGASFFSSTDPPLFPLFSPRRPPSPHGAQPLSLKTHTHTLAEPASLPLS